MVVVGAGLGGLTAATHLAVGGMKVLVLEQHHKVGGCASSFSRGEFRFDSSVHEIDGAGEGGHLRRILELAGVYDKVEWIPIPYLYRAIFPGLDFTVPGDPELIETAFVQRWPEEEQGLREFFQVMRGFHEDIVELGEMYRFSSVRRFFRTLGSPAARPNQFKY